MVTIAGFEWRDWYCRQLAFCEIDKTLGYLSCACMLLCHRFHQPGHNARFVRNVWAFPRPAAPAAPAAFPWALLTSPLPIYLALSALRPRRKWRCPTRILFRPSQMSNRTRFVSMDEMSSKDEEVARAALQPSPLRSPRCRRKRRRRTVFPTPPLEPVDK